MESWAPAFIVLLLISLCFETIQSVESMEQRGRPDSLSVPRLKRYYDYSPVDVSSGASLDRLFDKFMEHLRFQ
uniref:Neur_chan_LBD domain-containing protein n=1 Tax=Steinernema glaseri TaxID=37863 RepID=A0A1I7YFT9_9BILA